MLRLLVALTILHILKDLQVNAVAKRNLNEIDLSAVTSEEKLPQEVIPTGYILDVCPMPEDAYFKGRVTINLTWQEETNKIVFHADPELVIYQSELAVIEDGTPSRTVRILRSDRDALRSWYTIHLRTSLNSGTEAQLSMSFTGKLNTETHEGLFLSTYDDLALGETKYFVGSYLKPNFARKVFPCFDEPEFKVPFAVSIVRKNTMISLSNMAVDRSEPLAFDPTWSRDYFQESLPMTTYSLGILVSEFTSFAIEEESEDQKNFDAPIQIWGKSEDAEVALNFSQIILKAVDNVGNVLGLPYPFPKLDFVFIPGIDSNNWGLILQSEPVIPEILTNIIGQWVGNLVTPGQWHDEFINNGLELYLFAYTTSQDTDYQNEATEQILPVLNSMSDTYSDLQQLEENSESNPVTTEAIKVAMVLRMLNYALGEATLRQGIQRFISEKKYKTYNGNDLWDAITELAHSDGTLKEDITVDEIAESWISQSQQPVLTVKRNYKDNSATFSQHAYKKIKSNAQNEETEGKWVIPIVIVKEDNLDFSSISPATWLKEESVKLTKVGNRNHFIIVNPEEIGNFPVNYDDQNWKLISDFLQNSDNREKIPAATRSKLLRDAFGLAYVGELNYKTALNMVLFLKTEDKDIVWGQFFAVADYLGRYLSESPEIYEKGLRFLRQWTLSLYERLGGDANESTENEDHEPLRSVARITLCEMGYKPCIEEAKMAFDNWITSDGSECEMSILSNALYVFRWGTDEDFEIGLQHIVDNENNSLSEHHLFNGVAGYADSFWKVERILNISIFEKIEEFSDTDIEAVFSKLSENYIGYSSLFSYLDQNWDALKERFEGNEELWKSLVKTATSHFKTKENLELLKNFYSTRREEFGAAEDTIKEALSAIEDELQRTSDNYQAIEEWLQNYLKTTEDTAEDKFYLYTP